MEELIRKFIRTTVATQYLTSNMPVDQPLDLSKKKINIPVTSAQLENAKIQAENCMPCTEDLARETINPMVGVEFPTQTVQHPIINHSWQMMRNLILMPHQLESRQQVFNALDVAHPSTEEYYNRATLEAAAAIINATHVAPEEMSDNENITPNTTNTKRPRSSIVKSVKPRKRVKLDDSVIQSKCPVLVDNDGVSERVVIGANGTSISRKDWNSINWKLPAAAITRKILMAVFDRHTLAHNTLSGKPSPAFIDCNKPEKGKLNPQMVDDIIFFMTTHFEIKDRDVKCAITSKCADEAKSLRQRLSAGK